MAVMIQISPRMSVPFLPRIYIRLLFIFVVFFFTSTLFFIAMYNDIMLTSHYLGHNGSLGASRDLERSMDIASFMFPHRNPGSYDTSAFVQFLTKEQKNILMELARQVDIVLQNLSIPYVMYGGTLLGSFRHHDIIPWDDDIDILADADRRHDLFNALKTLRPDFQIMAAGPRFKFFSELSNRTNKHPWGWPYVDISFYDQNSTHIWDSAPQFSARYIYEKSKVFPTHQRPLGLLSLAAPSDSYANLRATYWTINCQSQPYSHKKEDSERKPIIVPCKILKNTFPFVHRTPSASGVFETLKLGDTSIHTIRVDEPTYAITRPYSLMLLRHKETFAH